MRRSASEIISNLESRIARLERSAHTMSKKDRSRLDELQKLEDQDSLTRSQNKEYEDLVEEYRKTPEYKGNKTANKEPQWVTWALEVLVESRETKAKTRLDLKERRNGQVWEYFQDHKDVILVSSDSDRSDYIIYENDDVKTQMNEEIMDEILDNHSIDEVVTRVPWARDIIVTTASLPYGDIGMWATQWAEEQLVIQSV